MTAPKKGDDAATAKMKAAHAQRMGWAAPDTTTLVSVKPDDVKQAIDHAVAEAGGKLTVDNVRGLIVQECDALKELLLEKNAGYGNSALDPVRVFSNASAVEQILVRIDDKLSRLKRGDLAKVTDETKKQTVKDLQGYLVLLCVAWRLGLE